MNNKPYAILFALSTILAVGFCLPGIQANSIAVSVENAWGLSRTHMGFFLVFLISVIIFGGVRRIAKFTQVMVPFMALGYLVLALIIIGFNVSELPEVFTLIISSAFSIHAGFGAIVGSAIEMGVKRGIYSNEAGQGTAPHAAAAAEVSHPVKQGLVQAFSVYIDTLLVCTATALMILLTGFYNVGSADGAIIYTGKVSTIFREKNQVKQVSDGQECGITVKDYMDFQKNDTIEAFSVTSTERSI